MIPAFIAAIHLLTAAMAGAASVDQSTTTQVDDILRSVGAQHGNAEAERIARLLLEMKRIGKIDDDETKLQSFYKLLGLSRTDSKSLEQALLDLGMPSEVLQPRVRIRAGLGGLKVIPYGLDDRLRLLARSDGLVQLTTAYAVVDGRSGTMSIVFTTHSAIEFTFTHLGVGLDTSTIGLYEYAPSGFSDKWDLVEDQRVDMSAKPSITLHGKFTRAGIFAPFARTPLPGHPNGFQLTKTVRITFGRARYHRDAARDAYVLDHGIRTVVIELAGEGPLNQYSGRNVGPSLDSAARGVTTVRFRRAQDGTVIREKLQPGESEPTTVPVAFIKGTWDDYLNGKPVEMVVTDEGYRQISARNERSLKDGGMIDFTNLLAVLNRYSFSSPRLETRWPTRSRLILNRDVFEETEQLSIIKTTVWGKPAGL